MEAPPRSELETLANQGAEYDWDQSQLKPIADKYSEAVQNLRANPVLADNIKELKKLQENLPGVVADVYQVKRKGGDPARNN